MTTLLETEGGRQWTVLSASPLFPLRGVFTVRLEVDADADDPLPPGPATLLIGSDNDAEPVELIGTIRPEDLSIFEGRAQALFVGGAGTLSTALLEARTYQQAPLETPITSIMVDAINDAGESFDDETAGIGGISVARWHRVGGRTGAQLLDRLAERFGLGWRMADDGLVSIAAETWPEANVDDAGFLETGPEDAINRTLEGTVERASIRPGTTLGGRRIEEVAYTLDERGMRALLRFGSGEGPGGLRGDLEAQTRAAVPPLPYRELHGTTVRRQNQDGTLDVEADEPTIGGITGVPYVPGIVGCQLVIAEGERVRLGFEGGDETKPFATTWGSMASGAAVARKTDKVEFTATFAIAGQATLTITPSTGAPVVIAPGAPMQVTFQGEIIEGSDEVFIRKVVV